VVARFPSLQGLTVRAHLTPPVIRGKWPMFNGQLSIVIYKVRASRGYFVYNQMPREAHPQLTNDN
jgi:hypothetical protein